MCFRDRFKAWPLEAALKHAVHKAMHITIHTYDQGIPKLSPEQPPLPVTFLTARHYLHKIASSNLQNFSSSEGNLEIQYNAAR